MALDQSYLWLRNALDEQALLALDRLGNEQTRPGKRLALDWEVMEVVRPVTKSVLAHFHKMRPVRLVSFDKTAESNWSVPWHQDRVIAVKEKQPIAGFANWSLKNGTWHCEPPLEILREMLFVRVHLDPADVAGGVMEFAAGSEEAGKVGSDEAEEISSRFENKLCVANRGDILILPMLTLHRSKPASAPTTRRVLRIDYAAEMLPPPLEWAI